MVLAPGLAAAQDATEWQSEPAPASPQPGELPPAPPAQPPAAPQPQVQAQVAAPVPPGQWVYTQQYGWIWMPYADAYTRVPANGYGEPYAYVYYPAYQTWTWLAAPWVWGIGPWPVFGAYGAVGFGWYGHGWWRYPAHWHYAPARGYPAYGFRPAYVGGGRSVAPAPYRASVGAVRGTAGAAPQVGGGMPVRRGGGRR
jgi:hypothetical protein